MNLTTANRACSLLYSYIAQHNQGVWLLPVNVCPDVPLTFCLADVKFEFVDINSNTLCIDQESCLHRITNNPDLYAGIVYVRTYGALEDTSEFYSKCRKIKPNLCIIDDRCLCLPSVAPDTYDADMVLYSTGHCKQIDLGGGGYAFTKAKLHLLDNLRYEAVDEESIYKKAYADGTPLASIPKGWLYISSNDMDNELYFSVIKDKLPQRLAQRESINEVYIDRLPKVTSFDSKFQDWRFNIAVPALAKDKLLQELFSHHLFASNHYHCANRLFDTQRFENGEKLFNTTINLFNDNNYNIEMAMKTCDIVNAVLAHTGG